MNHPNRLALLVTLLFVILLVALLMNTLAQEYHWGYAGETGPSRWGEISADFALCADGSAQSPIDISDATELVALVDIEFNYSDTSTHVFNNEHTIQVDVDEGSSIIYNGIRYNLLQFHFHHPSEHTLNGVAAAMEIHFVHQDPNSGTLAVVGILLNEGERDNEAYAAVFNHLPTEAGKSETARNSLSLAALLPERRTFFTYQGSLTTPPCSEIVRWLLLDSAIALSAAQIEAFASIYPGNARPTQPLGRRDLLLDAQ